jgi:hypothetical protein
MTRPRLQVPAARDLKEFPAPSIFQHHLTDRFPTLLRGDEPFSCMYLEGEVKIRGNVPGSNTHVRLNSSNLMISRR